MRKIFNKLALFFIIFGKLLGVNEYVNAKASDEIEIQERKTISPKDEFWLNSTENLANNLVEFIDKTAFVYDILEYVNELTLFPMFYQIPEPEFPQILLHLKPNTLSQDLTKDILQINTFILNFRTKISDLFDSLNRLMTPENEEVDKVKFKDVFPNYPFLKPLKFISNKREIESYSFHLYGLLKFKELVNNDFYKEKLLNIINNFDKLFSQVLLEEIFPIKKETQTFCLKIRSYNFPEQKCDLARDLFNQILDIFKIVNNTTQILSILNNFPKKLEKLYKRLSIENIMRSNFMEEIFGPTPKRIIVPVPDIIPILTHIKTELNLLNNDQSMKLFSYAANLQFLNYPIGNYHNSIDLEELAKIYIKMLFLRKNL